MGFGCVSDVFRMRFGCVLDLLVPRHNATRSRPARTAVRAWPCVRRVTVVHAWLKGFEIVFACCDTDRHERGSCFPAFVCCNTALVSSSVALCVLGFGVLSWFLSPDPGPVAVSCQCSGSSFEPRPTISHEHVMSDAITGEAYEKVDRSGGLLNPKSSASFTSPPCSLPCRPRRSAQFRFMSACFACRLPQRNGGAAGARHSAALRRSKRSVWRSRLLGVARAVEQRDKCAGVARGCVGVPRGRAYAVRTGLVSGGWALWEPRRTRAPRSGPRRSPNCNDGRTTARFPCAGSTSEQAAHICESRSGNRKQRQSDARPIQSFRARRPSQPAQRTDGTNRGDRVCPVRLPLGLEQPAFWQLDST